MHHWGKDAPPCAQCRPSPTLNESTGDSTMALPLDAWHDAQQEDPIMGKTKTTTGIPHTGINHSTSSVRTHNNSSLGFDWIWLLLALVAIAVISLA